MTRPVIEIPLRRYAETIALTGAVVLLPEGAGPSNDHPMLDQRHPDGRTWRSVIEAVRADLAMVRAGNSPIEKMLAEAAQIEAWRIVATGLRLYLEGIVAEHPLFPAGLRICTSQLVAIDARHGRWARTTSRWYRLGKQWNG
jgi:hypothetical protein